MPRSLTIHMPNGPSEYCTERVFEIGDKFERSGNKWVVTGIGETNHATGKHVSVTVRPAEESPST